MTVQICEVGPRDGLQNEQKTVDPAVRAELINGLSRAGLRHIECVSFVNDRRVPKMAGAEAVVNGIERRPGGRYAGLVLNAKGYDRLAATGLDEVHFAYTVTETFNGRNQNASVDDSIAIAERIIQRGHVEGHRVAVTLGAAFGCPFEGRVDPGRVLEQARRVAAAGADRLIFADTIGVAVPSQVRHFLRAAREFSPSVGVHLHNTRSTGFANAYVAVEEGADVVDASVGGIGGCPFAVRATGNIATEDLVYLLEGEGIDTGVDLDALIGIAEWVEHLLERPLPGQVYRAGPFPA